jgi:hypothetical protein
VTPGGLWTPIAGGYEPGYTGDGGPAIAAQFEGIWGIAFDPHGNIYLADSERSDSNNAAIRMLTPSTAPALLISSTTLPGGTAGTAGYSALLSASGGTGAYTWSALSTALPPGLALNAASGAITGTPTAPGVYDFTVTVNDSGTVALTGTPAQVTSQNFRITISAPAPTVSLLAPAGTVVGSAAITLSITGTNFDGQSTVLFTPPGGTQTSITPSMIQSAQLSATIPAALLTTAGTAQVAVSEPGGPV